MITHDIIKIRLSRQGYLPDYPPHLISDEEMCDAFLPYQYDDTAPTDGYDDCMLQDINYFRDKYPLITPDLLAAYKALVAAIAYHLNKLKQSQDDTYTLPNWVYSYMLGEALTSDSDQRDLHDMFVMLGTDNLFDEYTPECAVACYKESTLWIQKLSEAKRDHRPPTFFGEPHVLKSLRLKAADINPDIVT